MVLVLASLLLLVGVWASIEEFVLASKIDLQDRCAPGESGRCFSAQTGILLADRDFWGDPKVRYDDGRRTTAPDLRNESAIPAGTRVRLESWNGDVVSVYDLERQRRHRTVSWPERWDSIWLTCLGLGILLLALFYLPRLTRRSLRRRRVGRRGNASQTVLRDTTLARQRP